MRIILQRVKRASVSIDNNQHAAINHGLLLLVGFGDTDEQPATATIAHFVRKITNCRIFADESGKLNLSVKDVGGEILAVSQFTLYANTKHGNRPSFTHAQAPDLAKQNYELFCTQLKATGVPTQTGVFGADMQVELINDGPVTIIFDSQN